MTAPPSRTLLLVAAPNEARAVLRALDRSNPEADAHAPWVIHEATDPRDPFDVVVTGVGKANAAASTARTFDQSRHAAVYNLGVSGVLLGSPLRLLDVIAATHSAYADEGIETPGPELFQHVASIGFGPLLDSPPHAAMQRETRLACTAPPSIEGFTPVPCICATVSTCSGTDARAAEIARRTSAFAEDMESAAIAYTLARLAPRVPFTCLRVISNTTGNRDAQQWNLAGALDRLEALTRALAHALR